MFTWIEWLAPLRGWPAVLLALMAAVALFAVWEWRLWVAALALLYGAVGIVLLALLPPHLAVAKFLTGQFACLILYFGGRQYAPDAFRPSGKWSVRLLTAVGLLLLTWALTYLPLQPPGMAEAPAWLLLAVYGLLLLGLLVMLAGGTPLRLGAGVLIFLAGFQIFYLSLDQSFGALLLETVVVLTTAVVAAVLPAGGRNSREYFSR